MRRGWWLARMVLWLALCALAFGQPLETVAQTPWEPVAPGVDFRTFRLEGPNQVYVARMDRQAPQVALEASLAQGTLQGGKETVSEMAERYNGAIQFWPGVTGMRGRVAVAINGSFHDVETGVPEGGMVMGGWYAKRYDDLGGLSGLAWRRNDGLVFIGDCVSNPQDLWYLEVLRTGERVPLHNVNSIRRDHQAVVYTYHDTGFTRRGMPVGLEVDIEMLGPAGVRWGEEAAVGVVREVRETEGGNPVLFDHVVISAEGESAEALRRAVRVGDRVALAMGIEHFDRSCQRRRAPTWVGIYTSISGSFVFLRRGEVVEFDNAGARARNPRTAVCFNERYVYFVVVDGRAPEWSVGMTITELGEFCRDALGAGWGVNQDGGGSSTMWVNGQVVNRPSDGHERAVANGLMMVVLEPMRRSPSLAPGDAVRTVGEAGLRVGPGTNFPAVSVIPAGQEGVVLRHGNGLDGVLAKRNYWWLVAFGNQVGWVAEVDLERLGWPPRWLYASSMEGAQAP